MREQGIECLYIDTYKELQPYIDDFKADKINSLIVIGPVGIGKSANFIEAGRNKDDYHLEGVTSPCELYRWLFEHQKQRWLLLDDVDEGFKKEDGIRLLRSLTNPKPTRIQWQKQNGRFERDGILKTFETEAKCCILINHAGSFKTQLAQALFDRSVVLIFDPSPREILEYIKTWWSDKFGTANYDIVQLADDNILALKQLKIRTLTKALEEKQRGRDWQAFLLKMWADDIDDPMNIRMQRVRMILSDAALKTNEQQYEQYELMTRVDGKRGHSRRSWHKDKALYKSAYGEPISTDRFDIGEELKPTGTDGLIE